MNQISNGQPGGMDPMRLTLATAVATAYDLQKLRIQMGNRLCANFRARLGMQPSDPQDEQDEDVKKLLDLIKHDYDLIAQGVAQVTKTDGSLDVPRSTNFKPQGCITTLGEFILVKQYLALLAQEEDHFAKTLPNLLKGIPIYDYYLAHVKGIGPAMAAILIRYLDINRARYPSSFWKYAGLDVVGVEKDGERLQQGRGRYKDHLVPKQYTTPQGEVVDTVGISFNPFFKTKLMGVMSGSFLKAKSPYAELYYNYKNRMDNHPKYKERSKGHRHQMALRYMVKQFLVDLHANWSMLEGRSPSQTYQEAKLGHVHGGSETRPLLTHLVFPQKKAA